MMPNPATSSVVLQSGGMNLEKAWICDLAGRKLSLPVTKLDNQRHLFDLSRLASGLYQVIAETANGHLHSLRLIKE
jgi:hypothetical protein